MEAARIPPTQFRLPPTPDHWSAGLSAPHVASWYAPGLSDALGDRLLLCDNTDGNALEMLRLRAHLTMHPHFEARLRAQTLLLKGLHSQSFAPIHSIERLEDTGNALAIVSSHVAGVRLSEVLNRTDQGRRALPIDAALFIVRQLVLALAQLHSHADGLSHGVLTPERVVLTARGTVIVIEHALGAALAELGYDRQRFWTEMRLATVAARAGRRISPRTDVLQIGLLALSIIVGRNLIADDFPDGINALLFEADAVLKKAGQYPTQPLVDWLERALQQNASTSFRTAVEAANALSDWCDASGPAVRNNPGASSASSEPRATPAALASRFGPFGSAEMQASSVSPSGAPRPFTLHRVLTIVSDHMRKNRHIWIPVSAVAASVGVTLSLVGIPTATVSGNGLAALVVTTVPSGAVARIDGHQIGLTPLRKMLEPGSYQLELSKDGETRRIAVVLRRGQELSQYVEMTRVRPDQSGADSSSLASSSVAVTPVSAEIGNADAQSLEVRTDGAQAPAGFGSILVSSPVAVEVFRKGRLIGTSGLNEFTVPAGRVTLDLVNRELDFRTTTAIVITARRQHTLAVTLPDGVLSVNAQPWAEVWIDGRRVGETPLGNIRLSLGSHQVVFQHPELGTISREVLVKASGESRVTVDLRR